MKEEELLWCCTHGRGMGTFVLSELQNIGISISSSCQSNNSLSADESNGQEVVQNGEGRSSVENNLTMTTQCVASNKTVEGKLFFNTPLGFPVKTLLQLKTVERVLLVILARQSSHISNQQDLIPVIDSSVARIQQILTLWKLRFHHLQLASHSPCCRKRKYSELSDTADDKTPAAVSGTEDIAVRVSVKATGKFRKILSPDGMRQRVTELLNDNLNGFKAIYGEHADVTFAISCSDDLFMMGIPITQTPLSTRSYIKSHGLRPTTCAAMLQQADIQRGEVILDPMCGAATLLFEACRQQPHSFYVGADNTLTQLDRAVENLKFYMKVTDGSGTQISLVLSDAQKLPVCKGSVNVILTDMPFGQKHRVHADKDLFYTRCLFQFSQVLVPGGRAVVLTSKQLLNQLKDSAAINGFTIRSEHYLTLGRTEAFIVSMVKPGQTDLIG